MNIDELSLSFGEKIVFSLSALYGRYGYSQYKMSKFEEYDLYARNKAFLISDGVITFTDTNGKLMALKPDVTLSIIKNSKDEEKTVQKVYYNENVYRTDKGNGAFKEIMQVGLECIGRIDSYSISEVILLACKSLKAISESSVLDISHSGFVSGVIDSFGIPEENKARVLKCISEKNVHELHTICSDASLSEEKINALKSLITTCGAPDEALPVIKSAFEGLAETGSLTQLSAVISALSDDSVKDMLRIDFSVVDDVNYYNGIVFKGFVEGIPTVVLSGGQYDKLMQRMNRKSGAIGFAVYLDTLERFVDTKNDYDVDCVVLYNESTDLLSLSRFINSLILQGKSVTAQWEAPDGIRYKELIEFFDGEVTEG
ncbi:MAG: ATP phosphoribosyltransferase regulatory subunit [Clostridia bacterium]|nr:ATP phosphoribosyltransferase regulatory subunit [Clostridia bacterium]